MDEKIEMLEYQMIQFIKSTLRAGGMDGKIDYFDINMSNHNGQLQMNCTFKDKKKAY